MIMINMTHKTTKIMDANVHYWSLNESGPQPIILVHGFRGNHKALVEVANKLAKDRHVILVDLPGHGQSSSLANSTMGNFAQFLDEFIRYLDLKSFDLWAHSFGGSIAMMYVSMYQPQNLRSLILVSPALQSKTISPVTGLMKIYYKLATIMPPKMQRVWLASKTIDHISSKFMIKNVSHAKRQQMIEDGRSNLKEIQPRVLIEVSLNYLETNFSKLPGKITVPTLVIAGELDRLVSVKQLKSLSEQITNSTFEIVPKHGHLSPIEVPEHITQVTEKFLYKY